VGLVLAALAQFFIHTSPVGLVLASTARRWGWCSLRSRNLS
jgi:hypothetical protein